VATPTRTGDGDDDVACKHQGCACAVDEPGYCSDLCAQHERDADVRDAATAGRFCACGHPGCYFQE
jgi:hypothetical protein